MSTKYERTTWINNETPINADNLNNIEDGLVSLQTDIESIMNIVVLSGGTSANIQNN